MKSITKIILIFLSVIAFVACEKDDEDFHPKTVICMYGMCVHGKWIRKVNCPI